MSKRFLLFSTASGLTYAGANPAHFETPARDVSVKRISFMPMFAMGLLGTWIALFGDLVLHISLVSTREKVARVATQPEVTGMQHAGASLIATLQRWKDFVGEKPRYPMGTFMLPIKPKATVLATDSAHPRPAFIGASAINLFPKSEGIRC